MEYNTVKDISISWNISQRCITKLCESGRLSGAKKMGSVWFIPVGTSKPKDGRVKSGKYMKSAESEIVNTEEISDGIN